MITGNDMQKLNVLGYSFTNAGEGEKKYYHTNDSYTTVAPTEDAVAEYAAQGGTNVQTGEKIVGMTGDGENDTTKGILRFDGLKDGTYTIKEVLAPTGYKSWTRTLRWSSNGQQLLMKTAIIGRMRYPAARVTLTQSALIKTVSCTSTSSTSMA